MVTGRPNCVKGLTWNSRAILCQGAARLLPFLLPSLCLPEMFAGRWTELEVGWSMTKLWSSCYKWVSSWLCKWMLQVCNLRLDNLYTSPSGTGWGAWKSRGNPFWRWNLFFFNCLSAAPWNGNQSNFHAGVPGAFQRQAKLHQLKKQTK